VGVSARTAILTGVKTTPIRVSDGSRFYESQDESYFSQFIGFAFVRFAQKDKCPSAISHNFAI
jgi:hypothetical protein